MAARVRRTLKETTMSLPSPHARRNIWIRTIAGITGDVTVGVAMSSACLWIIQSASLGVFLSFLLWVVGFLLSLAISQYAVHPAVTLLLSDRKLDRGIDALSSLAHAATDLGVGIGAPVWGHLRQRFNARFAPQ